MKKLILLFSIIALVISFSHAQEKADLAVTVTDFQGNPSSGETILFVGKSTGAEISGVSDAQGKFKVQLPGGDTYQIKIKGVGSEQDYNELTIPKLQENQMYGEYTLEIMFEAPRIFTLDNVFFDTGSAFIRQSSNAELKELFDYMQLKPELKIEIAGHTDNVGEADSNMKLSQERADAVRNWLIRRGISEERVIAKGYGETQPVAYNDTPEGRQKNRRTEVRIISE